MKIVVAYNSITPRSQSLVEAEKWARSKGAELFLIHVSGSEFETLYWDTEGVGNVAIDQTEMYRQQERAFEEQGELLNTEIKRLKALGLMATGMVTRGEPVVEILKQARDLEVDLIIVGCHKRSGFQGMIYKSVVEKADRPVLVVPTIEG
ncbi:MAG: universal stress protein [Fibrobacterales bacterium]